MVNGKTVASVVGFSWDDFFARFSLAGMTNGDRCVRHKLDHDQITGEDIEKIVETYERVSLEIEKDHATPSEELVESDKAS
jgi:hypothetical protein